MDSTFTLTEAKNRLCRSVPISDREVANNTDYLNNVITTNETWIYCYASCTLSPSAFGEILEWELHEMRLCEHDSLHSYCELSIHNVRVYIQEQEQGTSFGEGISDVWGNRNFGFFFWKITHLPDFFFVILFKYLQDFQHFTKNFTKIFPFPEFPLNFPIIFYKVVPGYLFLNFKIFRNVDWKKTNLKNPTSMCPREYMILVCDTRPFDSDIMDC